MYSCEVMLPYAARALAVTEVRSCMYHGMGVTATASSVVRVCICMNSSICSTSSPNCAVLQYGIHICTEVFAERALAVTEVRTSIA